MEENSVGIIIFFVVVFLVVAYWLNHQLPNKDSQGNDVPIPTFDEQVKSAKAHENYSESRDIEACSDSGCYVLTADIEHDFDGDTDHPMVQEIYFNNGGYLYFDTEIGDCDLDKEGRNWCFSW